MKFSTKFNLKDSVKITELNRIGRIIAIYVSETGTQYSVRYFDGATPNTIYFYESEVSEPENTGKLGFAANSEKV